MNQNFTWLFYTTVENDNKPLFVLFIFYSTYNDLKIFNPDGPGFYEGYFTQTGVVHKYAQISG